MSVEWTVVDRKRGRQSKGGTLMHEGTAIPARTPTNVDVNSEVAQLSGRVAEAKRMIEKSPFYRAVLRCFQQAEEDYANALDELPDASQLHGPQSWENGDVRELIIYGLGTLKQGAKPPLYQLAFAQILRDLLPNLEGPPECYDPVFGTVDTALLESLGYKVMSTDVQCKRQVTQQTLFFMPHCERHLIENVLDANWSRVTLSQTGLLGNSFQSYAQRLSQADASCSRVCKAHGCKAVLEVALNDQDAPIADAFNDMSLHLFPRSDLCC